MNPANPDVMTELQTARERWCEAVLRAQAAIKHVLTQTPLDTLALTAMKAALSESQHHCETVLLRWPEPVAQVGSGVPATRTEVL